MKKGIRLVNEDICSVVGCGKKVNAKNLCHTHYANLIRCGNPLGKKANKCLATGCGKRCENLFCSYHLHYYINPRTNIKGERNPRWNGGISYFPNHYEVKKNRARLIKERGLFCAKCGRRVAISKIQQHHKDGNKKNHADSNIDLLCPTCHCKMPKNTKKYGDKNLHQWAVFFGIKYVQLYRVLRLWEHRTGLSRVAGIGLMLCLNNMSKKEHFNDK